MNNRRKLLSLVMMSVLTVFTLAGCGSSNADATTGSSSTSTSGESQTDSENTAQTEETSVTIGEITAIDGENLTLDLYESTDNVTVATDIDVNTLTATGETTSLSLGEDASVEIVSNGIVETSTADALAVGDMIAISDEDGQAVYILSSGDTNTGSTNATGNTDAVTDTTTDGSGDSAADTSSDESTLTGNTDSENTATVE